MIEKESFLTKSIHLQISNPASLGLSFAWPVSRFFNPRFSVDVGNVEGFTFENWWTLKQKTDWALYASSGLTLLKGWDFSETVLRMTVGLTGVIVVGTKTSLFVDTSVGYPRIRSHGLWVTRLGIGYYIGH